MSWFDHFQVASSRWLNVMLGGKCDEMLSSRAHRTESKIEWWLDSLFWLGTGEENHCMNCYIWERDFNECQ